jgi:hypothetical protein
MDVHHIEFLEAIGQLENLLPNHSNRT